MYRFNKIVKIGAKKSTIAPTIINKNINYERKLKIMSSIFYGGSVVLKPEVEKENIDPMFEEEYPFKMPKVLLEGCGEDYYPQVDFAWADDSVIVTRENRIIKYTESDFTELLAENEKGEVVWIDGRNAPYSDCWDGKYLGERREATKYQVEVFDLNTSQKTTYDFAESKTGEFSEYDKYRLVEYAGVEVIKEPFEIDNGVLKNYKGADTVVSIPEGVTELWYSVFSRHNNIEKVIVPASCVIISDSALSELKPSVYFEVSKDNPKYCSENGCLIDKQTSTLVRATVGAAIPNNGSITKIGDNAFKDHNELICLNIPNTIVEIGSSAFENCKNLESVIIPETVVKLGYRTFYHCRALSSVQLPDNGLSIIEYSAFDGCSNLTSIDLPDSIICLGSNAFSGCEKLEEVGLPTSISELGNHVFSGCNNLVRITIPDSIRIIGDYAFHNCTKLTEIKIPESVIKIGDGAFGGCESLSNIILPNSIVEIGGWVFSGCKTLVSIRIPESVAFVGDHTFCDCEILETVELPSQIAMIPDYMFKSCNKLANINLPNDIIKIGSCAFSWCEALSDIEIPVSVKKIGASAFSNTGLTNLCIPESVKIIEDRAFTSCRYLKEVNLPENFYDDGKRIFGVNLIKKDEVMLPNTAEEVESHWSYDDPPF